MACNATNSAAIDRDGNLLVWGSGEHGLLGTGRKEEHALATPQKLELCFIQTDAEKDRLNSTDSRSRYAVKDVAMG